MMRPLEFPKGPSCKPLLQRMADEKRFQMERGSIGGSYFIVQLPDGSMEKRMKMPINIDPGVHSSFNLNELVPGTPITPVPTMAVLPTITEAKAPEQSGSSGNSSAGEISVIEDVFFFLVSNFFVKYEFIYQFKFCFYFLKVCLYLLLKLYLMIPSSLNFVFLVICHLSEQISSLITFITLNMAGWPLLDVSKINSGTWSKR